MHYLIQHRFKPKKYIHCNKTKYAIPWLGYNTNGKLYNKMENIEYK
jgi:hypothetical protein